MTWTKQLLKENVREWLGDRQFVVVSNREPYIHQYEDGKIIWEVPAGGLTVALDPVMRACGGLWIAHGVGEADREVVDASDHVQVPPENPSFTLRRIWLGEDEQRGYYDGFSNQGLWPLCHIAYTHPIFDVDHWDTYQAVNRKFADAVLQEVGEEQAFVFIQDYHFALLSGLLKRPNIRTAHFWHIPWPNQEIFRICPWAEAIVKGLLGNDLLGFHTPNHCANFLDTVNRLLEARVDYERNEVTYQGHITKVLPFPISVDFDGISEAASSKAVDEEVKRLRNKHRLEGTLIGLGVDRLDYTKGIPERLKAVDRFLRHHPEYIGKVVFVQVAAKSRQSIEAYKRIEWEIRGLVNTINYSHRTDDGWEPILYLDSGVHSISLQAWYRTARFCFVSSLHDGMNLAAKEFIASRVEDDGVLIISRFAGASRELKEGLIINPYDVDQMARAIHRACEMSPQDQQKRMRKLREQVSANNIFSWASDILSSLFVFEFEDA